MRLGRRLAWGAARRSCALCGVRGTGRGGPLRVAVPRGDGGLRPPFLAGVLVCAAFSTLLLSVSSREYGRPLSEPDTRENSATVDVGRANREGSWAAATKGSAKVDSVRCRLGEPRRELDIALNPNTVEPGAKQVTAA